MANTSRSNNAERGSNQHRTLRSSRRQDSPMNVQPVIRRSPRLAAVRRSTRIAAMLDAPHNGVSNRKKRPQSSTLTNSTRSNKRRKTQTTHAAPEVHHTPSLGWITLPYLEAVRSEDEAVRLIESNTTHPCYRYGVVKFGLAISKGIGLKGSRKLLQGFAKEPLQILQLDLRPDCGTQKLSPYHCRVFRTLFTGTSRFKDLHFLHIKLNGVALEFSKLPPSLSTLRITFSETGAERRCLASLATGLRRAKCLTKLELKNWNFDHESMRVLSLGSISVEEITISGNNLRDDCVDAFVNSWRNDSPLQELRWESSTVTHTGVQTLLHATYQHPALKCLTVDFRETAQFDVIQTVARELPNLRLRSLKINATFPRIPGVAATLVANPRRTEALRALAQGIKANYFLWNVVATGGGMENMAGVDVQVFSCLLADNDCSFHLERNRMGAYLLTVDQGLPATVWCHVFSRYRRKPAVIYSFLRERPVLVQPRQDT